MKLTGITLQKAQSLGIKINEEVIDRIDGNHSRNNTTIQDEGIFYTDYGVMRDITLGQLFKFNVTTKKLVNYTLFLNGKKIDFIDNSYALEKIVSIADSVVIIKKEADTFIPWLLEIE